MIHQIACINRHIQFIILSVTPRQQHRIKLIFTPLNFNSTITSFFRFLVQPQTTFLKFQESKQTQPCHRMSKCLGENNSPSLHNSPSFWLYCNWFHNFRKPIIITGFLKLWSQSQWSQFHCSCTITPILDSFLQLQRNGWTLDGPDHSQPGRVKCIHCRR